MKKYFDQVIKNDVKTHDNIQKITTVQGDDYATGCLLDYNNFKKYYKTVAIDLNKQQALDANPKAIQHTKFTENLHGADNRVFFLLFRK